MVKLTPTDWRTLVKIFEADGFTQDRTTGSHVSTEQTGCSPARHHPEIGLDIIQEVAGKAIVEAAAEGLAALARYHDFEGLSDLTLLPDEATRRLRDIAGSDRYTADLWTALISNAAVSHVRSGASAFPFAPRFGPTADNAAEARFRPPQVRDFRDGVSAGGAVRTLETSRRDAVIPMGPP